MHLKAKRTSEEPNNVFISKGTGKSKYVTTNQEEEIASTYQPSQNQTQKVCRGTWSNEL